MLDKLPKDIQDKILGFVPQVKYAIKNFSSLTNFIKKPCHLEYPTKQNENAPTVIIKINNIELQYKDNYKKILDNISLYLERDDVKSLNTNSTILYKNLWSDVKILLNAPNKKELYKSWYLGNAFIYAEKESNIYTYDGQLKFFFNLVMYLYH